jgi:hypothetical protein
MNIAQPHFAPEAEHLPIELMSTKEELLRACASPKWRLRNLYKITTKEGGVKIFRPWPAQQRFMDGIWFRNLIPKARQRGFSTVIQLLMFDAALFVPNTNAAIIAQDEDTARQIFEQKVRFAWDHLPPLVKEMSPLKYQTKTELAFAHDSQLIVATSTRGSTLQYLHVSEFGKICQRYPERAAEIQMGSLPSVDMNGITCIESTVETPYGIFSDMVRGAKAQVETRRELSPLDWKLHFESWWDADEYEAEPRLVTLTSEDHAYFYRLEGEIGQPLSDRKRAWYVLTLRNVFGSVKEKMWSQYPSTLDEAFTESMDGLWLSQQMSTARVQQRITKVPYDPGRPVNTFWDIGTSDDTAIWFHQDFGHRHHFIDYLEAANEPPSYYVREMNAKGYVWGRHYLPHDAEHRRPGAEHLKTYVDLLNDLKLTNIETVQRTPHVADAVDQLREAFGTYFFDEERCDKGLRHLAGFSKQWNDRIGSWQPVIAKNGHQHAADALRQHAQVRHLLEGAGRKHKGWRRNKSGLAA